MVGWWWSGYLCGDKRQYYSVDVESLITINHHSKSSRPNSDKQRRCYRGFSNSPRRIDYEMMIYEGFYDKKHGICTRRLTPWLRRVLRVSVGVLIPTGTRRTPISARAHLQLGGTLVPRSTRLWLILPRPYSLGLRALVMPSPAYTITITIDIVTFKPPWFWQ